MARSFESAPDLGSNCLKGSYRSRLVLRNRLVPDLPDCQRHSTAKWPDCGLDSLPCCGPGQFFRGWRFRLLDPPRMVTGAARKALVVFGGFGVMLLIPTI